MADILEKYAVVTSSAYAGNISIPIQLTKGCKALSLRNDSSTVSVNITIKGITTPVPPKRTLVDHYEKDWFTSLLIETELEHNFILELYRE